MFYEYILKILNVLIQFILFLMGKFDSKVEQIGSRTAFWNGLCSAFEGPLYIVNLCMFCLRCCQQLCLYKKAKRSPYNLLNTERIDVYI
jgi:hypothetical protein